MHPLLAQVPKSLWLCSPRVAPFAASERSLVLGVICSPQAIAHLAQGRCRGKRQPWLWVRVLQGCWRDEAWAAPKLAVPLLLPVGAMQAALVF